MKNEITLKPVSGFVILIVLLCLLAITIVSFIIQIFSLAIPALALFFIMMPGFVIVNPNESMVLVLFGKYIGSVKDDGFFYVNPFTAKKRISLKANNLNGTPLKVNDKVGNPIEIAAVVVWQVLDTAKAAFEVENYETYVKVQSEAAVRQLAGSLPYDNWEDESADITLRGGTEKVNEMLIFELNERLEKSGVKVSDARISHLAYAQEIAGAMLQRQQATAVVAARKQIVEGAVGMVEMALDRLSDKEIVELDNERKAAMVSNLLVVLCSDRAVTPVVNTGTLYH